MITPASRQDDPGWPKKGELETKAKNRPGHRHDEVAWQRDEGLLVSAELKTVRLPTTSSPTAAAALNEDGMAQGEKSA